MLKDIVLNFLTIGLYSLQKELDEEFEKIEIEAFDSEMRMKKIQKQEKIIKDFDENIMLLKNRNGPSKARITQRKSTN
jgi:hypothetical protein